MHAWGWGWGWTTINNHARVAVSSDPCIMMDIRDDLLYNNSMKLFTHYTKVSQSQMDDLAIQIMEELYDQTDEDMRSKDMLRLLHSSEISVQTVCPNGKTLGFYLARELSKPVLKTFRSLGGDLCARDKHGNTLMFEALSGFPIFLGNDYDYACIELLQQHGLDLAHTNALGQTPIFGLRCALNTYDVGHIFSVEGHEEFFEQRIFEYMKLLQWAQNNGGNLRHKDHNGHSVFDMAYGVEFSVLRTQLDVKRAELEKENILKSVSVSTAITPRKM